MQPRARTETIGKQVAGNICIFETITLISSFLKEFLLRYSGVKLKTERQANCAGLKLRD